MSELALGQIKGLTVNSNVVTVPSGHTLYAPGHVLQVVSTTLTTMYGQVITSNGFSSIIPGLTATITPKSANSKFLVRVVASLSNAQPDTGEAIQLMRDSTPIGIGTAAGSRVGVNSKSWGAVDGNATVTITAEYLDSPGTTSAITYGMRIHNYNVNSIAHYVNTSSNDTDGRLGARSSSTITVMAIAA